MQYAPSLFSMNGRCLPTLCSGWTEIENIIRQGQTHLFNTKTKTKTKFAQNEFGGLCQCGDSWTMNKNQDFGDNRVNCAGSKSGKNLLGNHFQPLEKNS